jgi:hypothetical protein
LPESPKLPKFAGPAAFVLKLDERAKPDYLYGILFGRLLG